MSENWSREFKRKGFCVLKVLEADSVDAARKEINSVLGKNFDKEVIEIDGIFRLGLWRLQFESKLIQTCKNIFGDFGYINDFNLQCEYVDNRGPAKGWHVDCGSEGDNSYLRNPDYKFAKIGIYFQDNAPGLGGGIDVISYSHHLYRLPKWLRVLVTVVARKLNFILRRTVRTKAGDAIIFDSRLLHRSTPLSVDPGSRPSKFVLYWEVTDKQNFQDFLLNSIRRATVHPSKKKEDSRFFRKYLGYAFPVDYPEEYVSSSVNSGVNIFSLSETFSKDIRQMDKEKSIWNLSED